MGNKQPGIIDCINNCRKLIVKYSNDCKDFKSIIEFMNAYEYRMEIANGR